MDDEWKNWELELALLVHDMTGEQILMKDRFEAARILYRCIIMLEEQKCTCSVKSMTLHSTE